MISMRVPLVVLAACGSSTPAAPSTPVERLSPDAAVTPVEADAAIVAAIDAPGIDAPAIDAPPAGPVAPPAGPVALPKKCAADSPVDDPCPSYGGTYLIKLAPRAGGEHCVLKKAAQARITISSAKTYRGMGKEAELAPLARAIGKPKSKLLVGADVREGVCCIDLEISPDAMDAFVRVRMARGAKVVSAEASERLMKGDDMCDAKLDVTVALEPSK